VTSPFTARPEPLSEIKKNDSGALVEGRKDDQAKLRFDLIPAESLEAIVAALTYGSTKYGDDNWRFVPNGRRRYIGALMRHAWAAIRGEAKDPETGLSHWAHAGACILFLLAPLNGD